MVYLTIRNKFRQLVLLGLLLAFRPATCQLIVGEVDPYILVTNVLVGNGIKTSNISFTGYKRAAGFFENGSTTKLKMDAGVILSSGLAIGAKGPNNAGDKTSSELGSKSPGSPLLDQYATNTTYDAAVLQFDFVPQTEDIIFNYIFASEEYIEYVDKNVSDIFGFFISGPGITGEQNVALVPNTTLPVSIDNVNHLRNSQYFRLNPMGEKTLQADGLTTTLTARLTLEPCKTYTIKLAIADVGDDLLDSYVFIEAGSFKHKTNLGSDTFICKDGFDIELDAGNPGRKVRWSTGDTSHKIRVSTYGEYWVEVFTDCGSFKDYKKVLPGVTDIDLGKDTLFCGDAFNRKLGIPNRKFDTYRWSDGSDADTLMVTKPGLYWLEVDKGGCKKRDTIRLDLEPLPVIRLGKDTIICGNIDMTIGPKIPAVSYLWNTGDTTFRIRVTSPGTYSVLSRGPNCSDRDTILIQRRNPLQFKLNARRLEICENDTVRLRTGIWDTLNYETIWNTGDRTPFILVNHSGRYSVSVRDKLCNFIARDSSDVTVYTGGGNIWVANAFTPDHNGVNDLFRPATDISTFNYYHFMVFDRWGMKLFDSYDPLAGWDGTVNGKPGTNDVYIWTLNVKSNCSKGDNNFQRGVVHLIR